MSVVNKCGEPFSVCGEKRGESYICLLESVGVCGDICGETFLVCGEKHGQSYTYLENAGLWW